ncbi:hypothetical protein Tco_0271323 [Tanacetum coccineum]
MTKSKSFNKSLKQRALYHALMESILEEEDAMDEEVVNKLKKRKSDDADKDEGPSARLDRGLKRRKTSKDIEHSKKAKPPTPDPKWNKGKSVENKPTQNWLSDLAKAEKPSRTFDDLMSTPIDFNAFFINRLQISKLIQDILVGLAYNILKGTCRRGSTGRTYTTSLTKTKAAKYDLPGIEDMVPNLVSKHDVYSTKRILAVTNVKVKEWYGYGHLKEIEVRRSDQQLYKFMEGDFPQLHLHDIEDMLILLIQNRLFNLKGDVILQLAAALYMFIRRIVIQKRVEDLQLGVKSYQKKLNISRSMTHKDGITNLKPYSAYSNPQGFIYMDKLGRNRLMCSHELYKFSDDTLISLCDTLKDMANNLEMGHTSVMPRRRWSNLDKKRSRIMIKDINRQLLDRRLMRSLERFIGGRYYGEDPRLLQRTI